MKLSKGNKNTAITIRFCSVVTALLAAITVGAQIPQHRSPMVVGIIVEGLSDEYLSLLEPQFPDGGFKRLLRSGLTISDLRFGQGVDPTAATAVLYTGAAPSVNGIPSKLVYNPDTKVSSPVLLDSKVPGNFTDETLSPTAIKVSTISDEVRMDTDGDGYVYAISANPQISIIAGGHAGNGAFWINGHTGNWASTTYYRDMPTVITDRNYLTPLSNRIDTVKWVPMFAPDGYPLLSRAERSKRFRNTYSSRDFDVYHVFKSTPPGNKEITDMALALIKSASLGRDTEMDMLNISYNVVPEGASRFEIMDAYLRLDRDLARLFSEIDRSSGYGRASIFLAGVPSESGFAPDDEKWRTPHGEFSVKKAMSLLNMYLMAIHGNGDWVKGYNNRQFYLNRKLITDRNISLSTFRIEVADFLGRMAGVSNVFTIDDIIAGRAGDDSQALKRNTSLEHCGDIVIEVNPGWSIANDTSSGKNRQQVVRNAATRIPAFILAPNLTATRIDTPVDARAFVTTVARVLRIRAPSAASISALPVE